MNDRSSRVIYLKFKFRHTKQKLFIFLYNSIDISKYLFKVKYLLLLPDRYVFNIEKFCLHVKVKNVQLKCTVLLMKKT